MQIYLARNNIQAGPYTLTQLNAMLSSGQVVLSDLMWHDGMENWKTVGEMTNNVFFYNPSVIHENPQNQQHQTVINNPQPVTNHQPNWLKKHKQPKPAKMDISQAKKQLDLATIPSRILANVIDFGLFILAAMPLMIQIINSPHFAKLKNLAEQGMIQLSTTQQQEIFATIPQHIVLLTNLLIWGLLISQLLLLVKRGQTLGKMVMGIRILDIRSNAIPTITNLILIRTIVTNIVYMMGFFGTIFLLIDVISMLVNKDRQSLHDKFAKTYVVRADDTQTTPLKLSAD